MPCPTNPKTSVYDHVTQKKEKKMEKENVVGKKLQ